MYIIRLACESLEPGTLILLPLKHNCEVVDDSQENELTGGDGKDSNDNDEYDIKMNCSSSSSTTTTSNKRSKVVSTPTSTSVVVKSILPAYISHRRPQLANGREREFKICRNKEDLTLRTGDCISYWDRVS